eukprot:TRINITY_DN8054_c3_g1_i1.p1 TRINITY_DN8054_c3_g1~~TRINITY_DN8054_c3_g1_i1.p1  ORF type:complete len:1002 (+),score=269.86 TRINITY_DN8054_c3_g1_i1:74-3079(+)
MSESAVINEGSGCAGEITGLRRSASRMSSRAAASSAGGDEESAPPEETATKLGTIPGCYLPCLLNILGAVLFLRIGFSVGNMGVMGTLGILAITAVIAYLTIFSFSAIVTNGRMRGGGAYYMISRNLGPSFGGSSGFLFWFTYCVNVTFNAVAFTETIQDTFFSGKKRSTEILISCSTLFVLFLVGLKGADAFARTNYIIAVALAISLIFGIGTLYFRQHHKHLGTQSYDGEDYEGYFYPLAWDGDASSYRNCTGNCSYGLKHALWPDAVKSEQCVDISGNDQTCTFNLVFAVMFPAMVGTMQGANLSGDLKDPAKSIPNGTLAAVSSAFVLYLLLVFGQAGTMDKNALHYDMNAVQHACLEGGFVVMGVTAACLSTALGSMFGAARVLQAIARDQVFPILSVFQKGSGPSDEPRRALFMTFLVAEAGVLVGGLDAVAPILTNCFLVTYALVNLACFLLTIAGVPNWRPTFKLYTWHSALLGAILNVGAMFYLNPIYAAATLGVLFMLFLYVSLTGEEKDWGDISQALIFHQTRRMLLSLQRKGSTVPKFWRPSILLLSGADGEGLTRPLLSFCDDLKKGGLLIVGAPVVAHTMWSGRRNVAERARTALVSKTTDLKCFCRVAVGPTSRLAVQNLLLGGGLGPMLADTVVVALPKEYYASPTATRATSRTHSPGKSLSPRDSIQSRQSPRDPQRDGDSPTDGPITAAEIEVIAQGGAAPAAKGRAELSYDREVQGLHDIVSDAIGLRKNVGIACNFESVKDAAVSKRFGRKADSPRGVTFVSLESPQASRHSRQAASSNASPSLHSPRGWSDWFEQGASVTPETVTRVDVWRLAGNLRPAAASDPYVEDDRDFLVCVQLGYILALKHSKRHGQQFCRSGQKVLLRVFHFGDVAKPDSLTDDINELLAAIRVNAEVQVIQVEPFRPSEFNLIEECKTANRAMLQRCRDGGGSTAAIFATLPSGGQEVDMMDWALGLNELTTGLPPCILLRSGEEQHCTTTAI